MNNVEPLGIDGDEQAFRVTLQAVTAIVFHNAKKEVSRCTECQINRGTCEHVQMVEQYIEVNVQTFDWMGHIAYALDNWTRTAYRCLWGMLSDGLLFEIPEEENDDGVMWPVSPERHQEMIYEAIQRKLSSMKQHEVGYLRLMGAPDCLDDDFLEPYWTNAQDWLEESGAMAVYYEDGQYILEDGKV